MNLRWFQSQKEQGREGAGQEGGEGGRAGWIGVQGRIAGAFDAQISERYKLNWVGGGWEGIQADGAHWEARRREGEKEPLWDEAALRGRGRGLRGLFRADSFSKAPLGAGEKRGKGKARGLEAKKGGLVEEEGRSEGEEEGRSLHSVLAAKGIVSSPAI